MAPNCPRQNLRSKTLPTALIGRVYFFSVALPVNSVSLSEQSFDDVKRTDERESEANKVRHDHDEDEQSPVDDL